jgi:FkbM family methyltransferase
MCIPRVIFGDVTAAYCAEPDPVNYTCLVRNVRDNHLTGLILPDQLAIGSEDGTVCIERAKSAGGHRVVEARRPKHETIEVSCLTLDTWVDRVGIDLQQLVFVKVDAQGSEMHVLRGAGRVLACTHVAWQIEVDRTLLANRGFQAADLYGLLRQHFTHFVDLGRNAIGARVRPVAEMADALAYVTGGSEGRTDVLVFTLGAPVTSV